MDNLHGKSPHCGDREGSTVLPFKQAEISPEGSFNDGKSVMHPCGAETESWGNSMGVWIGTEHHVGSGMTLYGWKDPSPDYPTERAGTTRHQRNGGGRLRAVVVGGRLLDCESETSVMTTQRFTWLKRNTFRPARSLL